MGHRVTLTTRCPCAAGARGRLPSTRYAGVFLSSLRDPYGPPASCCLRNPDSRAIGATRFTYTPRSGKGTDVYGRTRPGLYDMALVRLSRRHCYLTFTTNSLSRHIIIAVKPAFPNVTRNLRFLNGSISTLTTSTNNIFTCRTLKLTVRNIATTNLLEIAIIKITGSR